jgi:copper chaperone CopZ
MIKIGVGLMCLVIILSACSTIAKQDYALADLETVQLEIVSELADIVPNESQDLRVAVLSLPGMTCQGCSQNSANTLNNKEGIVLAEVSLETKSAIVVYDANIIDVSKIQNDPLLFSYSGKIIEDVSWDEYN